MPHFYYGIILISFIATLFAKIYMIGSATRYIRTYGFHIFWMLAALLIALSIPAHLTFIDRMLDKFFDLATGLRPLLIRIAWPLSFFYYQALGLFAVTLYSKPRLRKDQIVFSIINTAIAVFYIYRAIAYAGTPMVTRDIENWLGVYGSMLYLVYVFGLTAWTYRASVYDQLPKIIQRQVAIFATTLGAFLTFNLGYCLLFWLTTHYELSWPKDTLMYELGLLNEIPLVVMFYIFLYRLVRLRLHNIHSRVQTARQIPQIVAFHEAMEELDRIETLKGLESIARSHIADTLDIPKQLVRVFVRPTHESELKALITPAYAQSQNRHTEHAAELFLHTNLANGLSCISLLRENKLLNAHELEFDKFYRDNDLTKQLITALGAMDAELFLPIFHDKTLLGYAIVNRDARDRSLYSNIEYEELIMYARYVGRIIHRLLTQDIRSLRTALSSAEQAHTQAALLNEHRAETITSLFEANDARNIGLIFYENEQYLYGNKRAQDLIRLDLDPKSQSPLMLGLMDCITQATVYGGVARYEGFNEDGIKVVLTAVRHIDENRAVVTVTQSTAASTVQRAKLLLPNNDHWQQIVALEATNAGRRVDHMFPGETKTVLTFKVDFLNAALSRDPVTFRIPEDDLLESIRLLHNIGGQKALGVHEANQSESPEEVGKKFFGVNPIYGEQSEPALFDQLGEDGTLFIKNIEELDPENQQRIADYIETGHYSPLNSTHSLSSNVRIVCSTKVSLEDLVYEHAFNEDLYRLLRKNILALPELHSMDRSDIENIAHCMNMQHDPDHALDRHIVLTEESLQRIYENPPRSMDELRIVFRNLRNEADRMYSPENMMPDAKTNKLVLKASQLGQRALTDKQLMTDLWKAVGNQSKMAKILGVNRTTVHRRLKEYGCTQS